MLAGMFAPRNTGASGPAIYGPAAWYDADDLTTLFQDSAGTVPVTTSGDPVGLWQDKSGNARHFSQSTSGQRPTWNSSGGFSWVEFDGSDDWLFGSSGMLAFAFVNLFAGIRVVSGGGDFGTILSQPHDSSHSNPFYRWSLQTRNSFPYELDFHANGTRTDVDVGAAAVGNDVLISLGISSMYYDGSFGQRTDFLRADQSVVLSGGTPAPQLITYPNATVSTMGAQVNGAGDRFKGRIYSSVIFDKAVTTQPWIDDIEAYINAKMP